MTRKVFKKAIAAVLVTAMCFVAVFTGSVSAANSASYTISGAKYEHGAKDSYVTADVTFTSASNFVAGLFEVNATTVSGGYDIALVDASTKNYTGTVNQGIKPVIHYNIDNNKVMFTAFSEDDDFNPLSSITITLRFYVASGSLSVVPAGAEWSISLSNVDITDVNEAEYNTTGSPNYIHIHNFGEAVGDKVKTQTCSICGEEKTVIAAEDVTDTNDYEPAVTTNVTFTDEGDVVLNALLTKDYVNNTLGISADNVYFAYEYYTDEGKQSAVATAHTSTELSSYYIFPCVGDNGIGRIADGVTGGFVFVDGTNVTKTSATWNCSILQYINAVISGSFAAKYKNSAKALYMYAKETCSLLGRSTDEYPNDYSDDLENNIEFDFDDFESSAEAFGEDTTWGVAAISVTTGFKPKMNIRFNANTITNYEDGFVTVKIFDDDDNLLYSKKIAVANLTVQEGKTGKVYSLYDVPTKYLANDVVIGVESAGGTESEKTIYYGYGRYAKARQGKADGDVFKYMVIYATALSAAY